MLIYKLNDVGPMFLEAKVLQLPLGNNLVAEEG